MFALGLLVFGKKENLQGSVWFFLNLLYTDTE